MRVACMRLPALALALLLSPFPTHAQDTPSSIGDKVAFDQKLGEQVPLNATFRDEVGRSISLGECFKGRPVILTLVYYNCPLLCTQVLNSLARSLKPLSKSIGEDFDVITVSIAPEEDSSLAAAKKGAYLARYGRPGQASESGWHFLSGEQPAIESLAKSVGFRYTYNPRTQQYTHAAGIVVLSPTGRITRYFFGLDYPVRDIQYALKEAESGRVGSPIARVLLLCYDYDAATGKYTLSILRVLRLAGSATAVGVAVFMTMMFRRERRESIARRAVSAQIGTADPSTP